MLAVRFIGHLRWVRWGVRYRLYEWISGDLKFAVPFFGFTYRGDLCSAVDRSVYVFGAYERELLDMMKTYIKKDSTVLDIGANVGHHTLFFSAQAKQVHAFEPFPEVANILEARLNENQIHNVVVHRIGLGSKKEQMRYYAPPAENTGIGSFVADRSYRNKPYGELPIERGDDVIQDRVGFIKIDVEHFEREVLLGIQDILHTSKPVVFLEFFAKNFLSEDDFRSLTKGYDAYLLECNRNFLFFFNRPRCILHPFRMVTRGEILLIPKQQ